MNRIATILLMLTALTLAACAAGGETTIPDAQLSVTANDITFTPDRLEAQVGQRVTLTLHNEAAIEHDFSIMDIPTTGEVTAGEADHDAGGHDMSDMEVQPDVHVAAPPGESASVEFIPAEPGEYEYVCTVTGHKEAGMTGILTVSAP